MDKITLSNRLEFLLDSPANKEEKPEKGGSSSFGEIFKGTLGEVSKLQVEADRAIEELIIGKSQNIHETMIAMEKASVSFKLMLKVRNKIIEAYQEVMKMPV